MKKLSVYKLLFAGFLPALSFFIISFSPTKAETEQEKLERLSKEIAQYQQQIQELQVQAGTLANQIAQFDAKIALTELKIEQTKEQIILLGGRIDQIQTSVDDLADAFNQRVKETYRLSRTNDMATILFSSPDLKKAVSRYHYLQKIQEADRELLEKLTKAQTTYKEQKGDLEKLEQVLGVQKEELDYQKIAKNNLLVQTKNNEARYQELLSQARAEFEAIQAIIAGKGEEEEAGHVNAGDRIASVIQGPSCNSNGSHLHFIVSKNGNAQNPFSFLKAVDHENCSGSSCGSGDGDPFNPSGSWDWPIAGPVKYTQGYGYTWAVQNSWVGRIYQFHNGIDINNESAPTVKAVQSGTLYQGSYAGSNGCRLRYVRVDHDEGDIDTFYLHINY